MYKELQNDIEGFTRPKHGYLQGWANQGKSLIYSFKNYICLQDSTSAKGMIQLVTKVLFNQYKRHDITSAIVMNSRTTCKDFFDLQNPAPPGSGPRVKMIFFPDFFFKLHVTLKRAKRLIT